MLSTYLHIAHDISESAKRVLRSSMLLGLAVVAIALLMASSQRPDELTKFFEANAQSCSHAHAASTTVSDADGPTPMALLRQKKLSHELHEQFMSDPDRQSLYHRTSDAVLFYMRLSMKTLSLVTFVLLPLVFHGALAFARRKQPGSKHSHLAKASQSKGARSPSADPWVRWQVFVLYTLLFAGAFGLLHSFVVKSVRQHLCQNISGHTAAIFCGIFLATLLAAVEWEGSAHGSSNAQGKQGSSTSAVATTSSFQLPPYTALFTVGHAVVITFLSFEMLKQTIRFFHRDDDVLMALALVCVFVPVFVLTISAVVNALRSRFGGTPSAGPSSS